MTEIDITVGIPAPIGGRVNRQAAVYNVTRESYDIALGDLPFNLASSPELPYERATAPYQKEQFDAAQLVGEQSLGGWWLRSQAAFWGGMGITYFEPLLGRGSENRFIDSRGVNVFDHDEVRLLHKQEVAQVGGSDLELVGLGESVALYRDGSTFATVDASGATNAVTPGGTNPYGIARIPGHGWLVGHDAGIRRMASDGTATDAVTGATAHLVPFWAKDRIFAVQGRTVFEIPYDSGGTAIDEDPSGTQHLITHPSTSWTWTHVAETGRAVWMAGSAGFASSIYVTTVDTSGDAGPVLTAPTVAIELPAGERVQAMAAYLDFLLIGTNLGFRVAVTSGDQAQLGPLLWRDQQALSVTARGDYAWVGLPGGMTRRVALGVATSNQDLDFAYANDAEVSGGGATLGVAFINDTLSLAVAEVGVTVASSELVESGWLRTGFIRYGTLEPKYFESVLLRGDVSHGSLALAVAVTEGAYSPVNTTAGWIGAREIKLNIPGGPVAIEKVSLQITLSRDAIDPTVGPRWEGYQLRSLPAPARRQRLFSVPIMLYDREQDRAGNVVGGDGFAYDRIRDLEDLEGAGLPVIYQDFRTGEARSVVIERVHVALRWPTDRSASNYEGVGTVTLKTVA